MSQLQRTSVRCKFQYPLRVLGCEKVSIAGSVRRQKPCFSTLCGFLAVRRSDVSRTFVGAGMFQYPLRVLGCEKDAELVNDGRVFQRFSTLCGFLVVRRRSLFSVPHRF